VAEFRSGEILTGGGEFVKFMNVKRTTDVSIASEN
jgi:hypothetical protein